MKITKLLLTSLISLSTLSFSTNANAQELKGNKTNIHVSEYGSKNKKVVINKGMTAPTFSTVDSNGKKVNLADFKGKKNVLLVFYPGDGTPVCTNQLSDIRDDYKGLQKLNIQVFGVNPGDAASHNTFIKDNKFPFQLLVDQDHKISDMYDAMNSFGFVNRTVVLIDKQGKIVLFERGVPDVSPSKVAKLL